MVGFGHGSRDDASIAFVLYLTRLNVYYLTDTNDFDAQDLECNSIDDFITMYESPKCAPTQEQNSRMRAALPRLTEMLKDEEEEVHYCVIFLTCACMCVSNHLCVRTSSNRNQLPKGHHQQQLLLLLLQRGKRHHDSRVSTRAEYVAQPNALACLCVII